MFENEDEFRKFVGGLRIDAQPDPAHRARLRRQMLATFEQTGNREQRTEDGRQGREVVRPPLSVLRLPFLRLALAAVVLIAATAAVWNWLGAGRGPLSLRQVRLATTKMPWLHVVVSRYENGTVRTEKHWYNFAAEKAYVMMEDGVVLGWEYGAGRKKLAYSPRLKILTISELSGPGLLGADAPHNLVEAFAVFAARDDVRGSTVEHEGEMVRAFEIEGAEPGLSAGAGTARLLKMTMMAEPRSKRLVAGEAEYRVAGGNIRAREEWVISYPGSGPASVFDLGVPASVTIIDRTRKPIGTPGAEPLPVPTPAPTGGFRLVPLEIELPKPMFIGTPQDRSVPNLEKPRQGPRPPFLAPAGTTNVAFGKPVSSSDIEPVIGSLGVITDGDKQVIDGSFVELGPWAQYVTIDLREPCEIYAVVVWHHHRWPRVYFDVVVQVSDDRAFKTGVRTLFNNDRDNSLGLGAGRDLNYTETHEGKLIDGKAVQGRYVRLYSNGNTNDELNHYIEVEVYGRPLH